MPKFSIIIPVYNVAPYLRERLDSVLVQMFTDWEAICVDDGSTDDSGAILDEYAAKDARIKVIHQKNAGVSVARNAALDAAKGEWLCFLDADDVWNSGILGHIKEIIDGEKIDLVRLRFKYFKAISLLHPPKLNTSYKLFEGQEEINKFVSEELIKNGFVWLIFLRRELIKGLRFAPKVKYAEDALFVLEAFSRISKFAQSEFEGYCYRLRQDSGIRQPLDSAERVLFLQEFERVAKLYPQSQNKSWMGWFAVLKWILKPSDLENAKKLHILFKKLCKDEALSIPSLKLHERLPAYCYMLFGWRWPARWVYGIIGCLKRRPCKDS